MYNVKTSWLEVGGLAKPSKMPSYAYSLPAKKCITGAKLRAIKNTTITINIIIVIVNVIISIVI